VDDVAVVSSWWFWPVMNLLNLEKILDDGDEVDAFFFLFFVSFLVLSSWYFMSPGTTTCFRYESSIVGSYSSTKWFWTNWTTNALFPTPPSYHWQINPKKIELDWNRNHNIK
jgi:hypothetical protein